MLAEWMIPVMNLALLFGVAFVMPSALGGAPLAWLGAAVGVLFALDVDPGPLAVVGLVPWLLLLLERGWRAVRELDFWKAAHVGLGATAALALVASRLEFTLFGIQEPIVKLTALHFSYAGVGTLALAQRLVLRRKDLSAQLTRGLVLLAPPLVATGFVLRSGVFQVGGAVVMTLSVWSVSILQWLEAQNSEARVLWRISSVAPWVAMVLGVAWAANQYVSWVPALTVVDMVPTHGALNAFAFVGLGHLAMRLEARPR